MWDQETNPEAPVDYTEEDVLRRIKAGPNVVVIQPERNMEVPVEVEVHDVEPGYVPDEWEHIVEASLHLPTGRLQVHECTGGVVAEFKVEPGWYRVRSFHGGFDTIAEYGAEGEDYYRVVLWPAPPAEVVVVKQWVPPQGQPNARHQAARGLTAIKRHPESESA
ncbi:MAG: hypothetical protein M3430_16600 [Acidobacteriota bacterium]|nr:hypothetical protein [Acidobacteriota bacterium]